MQTCSKCNQLSPDSEMECINCGANLAEYSEFALSRKKLIENLRVTAIRISVSKNACPTCRQMEGVYPKQSLPVLPVEGCSSASGCNCYYAPILDEIFP